MRFALRVLGLVGIVVLTVASIGLVLVIGEVRDAWRRWRDPQSQADADAAARLILTVAALTRACADGPPGVTRDRAGWAVAAGLGADDRQIGRALDLAVDRGWLAADAAAPVARTRWTLTAAGHTAAVASLQR